MAVITDPHEFLLVVGGTLAVASFLLVLALHIIGGRTLFREFYEDHEYFLTQNLLFVVVILAIPVVNMVLRAVLTDRYHHLAIDITPYLAAIEGSLVASLQVFANLYVTAFFTFIYLPAYVMLIALPVFLYFLNDRTRMMRKLGIAYALVYFIAIGFFTAFIAWGPRNACRESPAIQELYAYAGSVSETLYGCPAAVLEPMYTEFPWVLALTSFVNLPTNVFPSVHTAMSVTVLLFAYHSRKTYPRFFHIAAIIAPLVLFSTMYTGIHWFLDVVAGTLLAVFSYKAAFRISNYYDQNVDFTLTFPVSLKKD